MDYALQIIVFSILNVQYVSAFVNEKQTNLFDTSGQLLSYVIAASYLFFYVAVCFGVGIALQIRFKRRKELQMGDAYPQYETLFEFLKPTKSAQAYIILFILRRALFAGVLLFISTNFFQVFALNFISLAQIMYLMLLKPFEDPQVNKIEVFNEIVVMICNYHLLFFID